MSGRRSTLEKIPLFPYTDFLRINGEYQHNSDCGGIASIVAILLVLAVLIMKLVEVFKMETIVSSSKTSINLEPPMTSLSTVQTSANYFPYMIAIGYYQDPQVVSTATSTAYYMTRNGSLSTASPTLTEIKLQPCTTEHFSVIPNITTKATSWGLTSWQCLPLNQTWQIGGDYELSSVFKRLQFTFTCSSSSDKVNCGQYSLYTLNSFINPSDPLSPSTYYISSDSFLLKDSSYYEYTSKLDDNELITDTTVWPGEKLVTTTSFQCNELVLQQVMDLSTTKATILKIEKSVRSTIYNRSFLKLVDALAFVGGIFSSILAIFFFMKLYGRYNFEMKFAEYYFNCNEARGVGFLPWIKQNIYNVLAPTPLKPDWEIMEKRVGLTSTVNKIMDIFFLHKRIAFLQQSLQLLLEPHQIKGLHLVHTQTKEEADQNFRNHQLRDRVILYLKNYNERVKMLGDIDVEEQIQQEPKMRKGLTSAFMIHEELAEKKEGIVHQALFDEKKQAEELKEQRKEIDEVLNTEMMNIDLEEDQVDFDKLETEFQNQLLRLFQEGERYDGDQRSIIICSLLEGWIKKGIQLSTKQNIITKSLISKKFSGLIQ